MVVNKRNLLCGSVCITLLGGAVGCAALKISVDVYRGELILVDDNKLGEAASLARNTYLLVNDIQSERLVNQRLANHIKNVVKIYNGQPAYNEQGIDELWSDFTNKSAGDKKRPEVKARLARALFRFGASVAGLGRARGLPEAIKLHRVTGLLVMNMHEFTDGVTLEEAGRWIMWLTDEVQDTNDRTTIARMMQSVTTGHTATMAGVSPITSRLSITKALDSTYWSSINDINVFGAGETEYVIIKDDIGNWHIKSITASQDEIVEAIFDGAQGMVNILAAQYGVRTTADNGKPVTPKLISEDYIKRQLKVDKADKVLRSVRVANLGLQVGISPVLKETDVAKMRARIRNAAQAYAARVKSLKFDAD